MCSGTSWSGVGVTFPLVGNVLKYCQTKSLITEVQGLNNRGEARNRTREARDMIRAQVTLHGDFSP
jgi:hypothetical protein